MINNFKHIKTENVPITFNSYFKTPLPLVRNLNFNHLSKIINLNH